MFQKDLKAGQAKESELGTLLESKGVKVEYNISTNLDELRKYDLKYQINNKEIKIEVKADFSSSSTGNIAVELKCIRLSEANYFAYYIPQDDSFYFVPTITLRNEYYNKTFTRLTESRENGTQIMLFPVEYFKTLSRKSLRNE
jgi:hypothetical protein